MMLQTTGACYCFWPWQLRVQASGWSAARALFLDRWPRCVAHQTFPFIAGREQLRVKDLAQYFQTFDDARPRAIKILIAVGDEDAITLRGKPASPFRPGSTASCAP